MLQVFRSFPKKTKPDQNLIKRFIYKPFLMVSALIKYLRYEYRYFFVHILGSLKTLSVL